MLCSQIAGVNMRFVTSAEKASLSLLIPILVPSARSNRSDFGNANVNFGTKCIFKVYIQIFVNFTFLYSQ